MGSRVNKDRQNRPNRARAPENSTASTFLSRMCGHPQQQQRQLPPSLSKYFNTTAKAKRLMDPNGRVCELDAKSEGLELAFSTHPRYHAGEWRQMVWSQRGLWEASQEDLTMRISRKSPLKFDIKPGTSLVIFETDFQNQMSTSQTKEELKVPEYSTTNEKVTQVQLGYAQCKLQWIYLISERQVPESLEIIEGRKHLLEEAGKGG